MFQNCKCLSFLPNISKIDLSKIMYMDFVFDGCLSLTYLPHISKLNLKYVYKIKSLRNCPSLTYSGNLKELDKNELLNENENFENSINLLISKK